LTECAHDIGEPELIASVIKAHADVHVTAHGENETAPANKKALIEPFHQQRQKREDQKLRQAHSDEHFTDLQRAVDLNGTNPRSRVMICGDSFSRDDSVRLITF